MNYSDEQLSAFLDGELNHGEMEAIRNALITDEQLADRLAELAQVDTTIAAAYGEIDNRPMPASVTRLLTERRSPGANVIPLTRRRHPANSGPVLAVAASLVLALGLGLGTWWRSGDDAGWQPVAAVLDAQPSGVPETVSGDTTVTPRLSFLNKRGEYCRLYRLASAGSASEGIACRRENQWQLAATTEVDLASRDLYQPASGGSALESTLDAMMAEGPFDHKQESNLLESDWQAQ